MRRHAVRFLAIAVLTAGVTAASAAPVPRSGTAPECDPRVAPCKVIVTKFGSGKGTVTSIPAGIDCGDTCEATFPLGTMVILTATADSGSEFRGWNGCPAAAGPSCMLEAEPTYVTATFMLAGEPAPPEGPPAPPPPPGGTAPGCTITGTPGDDFLVGTPEGDVICGLGGKDHVHALEGNDVVHGGDGNDQLEGQDGDDVLRGGRGKDMFQAGSGNDLLNGGPGADLLEASVGNDTLVSGPGRDLLFGNVGRDRLHARDGLADQLDGGPGLDRARVDRRDSLRGVERRF